MQVSKWRGHSTFTLTLDTYGDYIPERYGRALTPGPPQWERLNEVLVLGAQCAATHTPSLSRRSLGTNR